MNKRRCLMICLALALAGVMLLAGPGWAQKRGAAGPAGQGNQLCTPGQGGVCAVNIPNNAGDQNRPRYGAGTSQRTKGPKGPRGGGRFNQPNTQATPPAASQQ